MIWGTRILVLLAARLRRRPWINWQKKVYSWLTFMCCPVVPQRDLFWCPAWIITRQVSAPWVNSKHRKWKGIPGTPAIWTLRLPLCRRSWKPGDTTPTWRVSGILGMRRKPVRMPEASKRRSLCYLAVEVTGTTENLYPRHRLWSTAVTASRWSRCPMIFIRLNTIPISFWNGSRKTIRMTSHSLLTSHIPHLTTRCMHPENTSTNTRACMMRGGTFCVRKGWKVWRISESLIKMPCPSHV